MPSPDQIEAAQKAALAKPATQELLSKLLVGTRISTFDPGYQQAVEQQSRRESLDADRDAASITALAAQGPPPCILCGSTSACNCGKGPEHFDFPGSFDEFDD